MRKIAERLVMVLFLGVIPMGLPVMTATTAQAALSAPTISSIVGGNTYLTVNFSAPAGTPTNYEYSTDAGLTWTSRNPAATFSPLTIFGLTNGTSYSVKIRARDSSGSGAASAAVSGTPTNRSAKTSTEAFLQGAYAEVGIRPNGAFGSSSVPTGFHATSSCLGFRADRQKNGWAATSGSSPAYDGGNIDDGDFFCPGTQFEGWALQANGASTMYNGDIYQNDMAGTFSTPVLTDSESSVKWTGSSNYQGLSVEQTAIVPTTGQLLHVDVKITNTTGSAVNNIYYVRNFDPDNDTGPGVYQTTNTVIKDGTAGTGASVKSTWTNGSAIYIQSSDSRAHGAICITGLGQSPLPTDIYNGVGSWSRSPSVSDVGTGIAFNIGTLAAGASTTVRVTYNLTEAAASSPSVTTSAATNVGVGTTATLNGTVNANGSAATVTFKYGTSSDLSGATSTSASPSSVSGSSNTNVSLNLTGLTAGTTYYYQTVATNSYGTNSGSILSFTPIASATVVNLAVSNLASTTVTLNGTVNPGGGTADLARFVYSTVPTVDSSTTTADLTLAPLTGTSVVNVTKNLTGLSMGTIYYYYLEVRTQAGTVKSNILSFTTTPAPSATTNAATSVTATSATLNGTVNAYNWSTTSLYFSYATNSSLTGAQTVNTTPSQATGNTDTSVSAAISGLTTGTTYYYKLTAVNANGSNSGSVLSFTPAAVPTVVTGTATNSGLKVTFPGTVNANGSDATVSVIYGTTSDLSSSTATLAATPSTVTGASTTNVSASPAGSLSPSTTYYFKVVATNAKGTVSGSINSITTPAAVLVGPTTTIAASSATVGVESTLTLTITFSAVLSSFSTSMITSTLPTGWAMADAVATGPSTYTVQVIPSIGAAQTGSMSFSISENKTTDTFGNGNQASNTVNVTALPAGLTPTFTTPVATDGGFTVSVNNYSASYSFNATVNRGSISTGTASGTNLPLTVSGLSAGETATVTVTTTRTSYGDGSASVLGTAKQPGRLAVFDTPVRTATGFTVNQTNYDSSFSQTETVTAGIITRGTILGSVLPLTISGLGANETSTVTVYIDKTGYLTGTTTLTSTSLQTQSITFNALSNKTYGDAAFTLNATGGGSLNPVTFSVGTPAVCSTSGTNGTILTILTSGTCTVHADQLGTTSYAAATRVTRSFTINQKSLTITANNIGINFGATVTPSFTTSGLAYSDSLTAVTYTYSGTGTSTPPSGAGTFTITPSNAVFGVTSVSSNYVISYVPGTLTITPNSISGLDNSQLTLLASITASDSVDSQFSAVAGSSSVLVSIPRGTLPNGSVLDAYSYSETSTARAILTKAGNFILQAVIAWRAPDGTTPITNTGKSVSVTVTSSDIHVGSRVYAIIGGVATVVGTATAEGTATFLLTEDPVVVITPTVPDAPANVTALNGGNQTATVSWQAPAINGGSAILDYTATSNSGQSCTSSTLSCNVTGLTNGTPYTFTVTARNAIGASDSSTATTSVVPLHAGLTPQFSSPNSVASGYTVNITNYDPSFSWAINVNVGAVAIGTATGSTLPLTVSGLSSGQAAIITANATQTGYVSGTATVSGTALGVYVVTYDATTNGGTAISPSTVNFTVGDPQLTLPTPVSRNGYTFTGWFTSCSGGTAVTSPFTPIATVTLCAQWSAISSGGGGNGGGSSGSEPISGGGGSGGPKQTALYFQVVDPIDGNKFYSKAACVEVYSRTLIPQFMGTACTGNEGRINLLVGDGKVSVRVFDLGNGGNYREYFGEVENDQFTLDSGKYFPGTTRYSISVPAPKSEVVTPVPTPTPTPVVPPAVVVDLGLIPGAASLKLGESSIEDGGKASNITFVPNLTRTGLVATGSNWSLEILALGNDGKSRPLTSQGFIDAVVGGKMKVIGKGYQSNSDYRIFLLANLTLVETSKTNADGEFNWIFDIPAEINSGKHVIQVNGTTPSKGLRTLSLGINISAVPVITPTASPKPSPANTKPATKQVLSAVISFDFAKYTISAKQLAVIKKLSLSGSNVKVSLVGYAQKSGTNDDLRISLDRALEVRKAILKLAPKAKITVLGGGTKAVAQCKVFKNRCVIAKVSKG